MKALDNMQDVDDANDDELVDFDLLPEIDENDKTYIKLR